MRVKTIRVEQWLDTWNDYKFPVEERQRQPARYYLIASFPVDLLRRLADVPRRQPQGPRAADPNTQREHQRERSAQIRNFVTGGYPWATLSKRDKDDHPEMKKPGLMPTAIVANIVGPLSTRYEPGIDPHDRIEVVEDDAGSIEIVLPDGAENSEWKPQGDVYPLEIIDGQHRLLAFEHSFDEPGIYEVPVVVFVDLDISWQAYLFWTINVSPKKISPSLAYDLYPLLRTQDWLEFVGGPLAYREARAQELTEALWSHPQSPWSNRIAMLGRETGKITQAAFIRSLTASFLRKESRTNPHLGGLFGAPLSDNPDGVLEWNRTQQAAYIIHMWRLLEKSVEDTDAPWAIDLREQLNVPNAPTGDQAFSGRYSMLAGEQGIRGFLFVVNDVSYVHSDSLGLRTWRREPVSDFIEMDEVSDALHHLQTWVGPSEYFRRVTTVIAQFDWRSMVTPNLPEQIRNRQAVFRAGTGYREVRIQLLKHLANSEYEDVSNTASQVLNAIGEGT